MTVCHVVDVETVKSLAERKNGSWRSTALALGYAPGYAATLCDVARGKAGSISREGENVLRERLGLAPRHYVTVAPCPDCGSAHTGRCHGKPVARVVIVSGKPRNRKRYLFLRFDPDEGDIRTACAALRDSLRVALAFEEETRT